MGSGRWLVSCSTFNRNEQCPLLRSEPLLIPIVAIWLFLPLAASAQPGTGRVTGTIVEARTGVPLAAVLVKVQSTGQQAFSDADGRFEIVGVPSGPQIVLVSVVGFGLVRRDVAVAAGEAVDVTIAVAEGASTYVEDVAVAGTAFRDGGARCRQSVRAGQPRSPRPSRTRCRRSLPRRAGPARRRHRRRLPRRVRRARPWTLEHRHLDRRRRQPAVVSHRPRRAGHRLARADQQRHPRIGDAVRRPASAASELASRLAPRLHHSRRLTRSADGPRPA